MKPVRRARALFRSCNPTPLFAAAPPPASLPAQGAQGRWALHRLLINYQTLKETDGNNPLCFLDSILKPGDKPKFGQEVNLQENLNKQTKTFTFWGSLLKSTF